jgi:hypothetical protein
MGKSVRVALALGLVFSFLPACTNPVSVTKPPVPTGVAAAAVSSSSIEVTWIDASNGKTSFRVERSVASTTGFSLVATPGVGQTRYTDSGLSPSTRYYYRLASILGTAVSEFSVVVDATTTAVSTGGGGTKTPPKAPTGLTATGTGTRAVHLTWTDAASDETGFNIARVTGPSDPNPVVLTQAAPLPANTTSYYDTSASLQPATDYGYVVTAFNAAGSSDLSNLALATTLSKSALAAPAGALATRGVFKTMIYVDWTPVTGASTYKTYESYAVDAFFTLLGSSTTSYAWINNSTSGVHNFFRVSAVDSSTNETGRSATVEGWAGSDIFNEGFEASRLQGYWEQRLVPTSTQVVYALSTPGANGTASCVKLSGGNGTSNPGLSADINAAATPSSIGFWVKAQYSGATVDTARFGSWDSTGASNKRSTYVALTKDGLIIARDYAGTARGNVAYSSGSWNHIELRNINFTNYSYDFYVNGTLAAAGVSFYYPAPNMKYFDIYLYDANAVVYWDEILVK